MNYKYAQVTHAPPFQFGDCFAACMRTMLQNDDFPHVLHDGCDANTQRQRTDAFLKPLGLAFMEWPVTCVKLSEACIWAGHATRFNDIHWMVAGCTIKENGHYCIGKGNAIIHNPSEGVDIVAPFDDGVYWIGVIVNRV